MELVTFIIPSLNRPTLIRAIKSLESQINHDWRCIIVFDGLDKDLKIPSSKEIKIKVMKTEKLGDAGLVRNVALPFVETDWIAFLDDDDIVKPTYVEKLKYYVRREHNRIDAVHFSIERSDGSLEPALNQCVGMSCGGISYAVKTSFVLKNNIIFDAGFGEDKRFFEQCKKKGKPFITYDPQYFACGRSWWHGESAKIVTYPVKLFN
jgi:glycosyltransferase involved in cell wall biosynthesis